MGANSGKSRSINKVESADDDSDDRPRRRAGRLDSPAGLIGTAFTIGILVFVGSGAAGLAMIIASSEMPTRATQVAAISIAIGSLVTGLGSGVFFLVLSEILNTLNRIHNQLADRDK